MLLAGCGSKPTEPAGPELVDMKLTLSSAVGGSGQPVTVAADATNFGHRPVLRADGCVELFSFDVYGPDGEKVDLLGSRVLPLCPPGVAELAPGQSVSQELSFTGTLFETGASVSSYPAPPGEYAVVARFTWWSLRGRAEAVTIGKRVTFRWSG